MANRSSSKNNSGAASWILPILLLAIIPPVGVLWIVLKILSNNQSQKARSRHPYYTQREAGEPLGARTTAGASQTGTARQESDYGRVQEDKLKGLDFKGKRLAIVGGVITALFGLVCLSNVIDALNWLTSGYVEWFIDDLIQTLFPLTFAFGGAGVLWAGLRRRKQVRLFRRYLAMVGKRHSVSLSTLSDTVGRPVSKVTDDLEDMLNDGFFPQGFLDYGGQRLVASSSGVTESSGKKRSEPRAEKKSEPEEDAVLSEIRKVNEDVKDEQLSRQIDRIGMVTAQILEYQKSHPEKAPQLHSFLSYYLPTTLKILRAYARLEAQEVRGENITSAMERIEGMMDKVVEGFEKQLDMLFQGDAMDITTDVEVLERMLAKDGLSDHDGMQMTL